MIELPDSPSIDLTKVQLKAFNDLRKLLSDVEKADARYDSLKQSKGGKVISTDIARYLDSRYAKEPPKGKGRDMTPGWDLAWRYSQDRFVRELLNRWKRKTVRLMAGGWGAGKTFALRNEPTISPDLVWDGTLEDPVWAAEMIEIALTNRWKVEVAYVYRDLELAIYGAIEREREVGRGVPLHELPGKHRSVQRSILKLTTLYKMNQNVSFLYLHNLGTQSVPADTNQADLKDLELNGALHYLERHEQYYAEAAKTLIQGR